MHSSVSALMSKPKPIKEKPLPTAVWLKVMPDGNGGWGGMALSIVDDNTEGAVEYVRKDSVWPTT